MRPPATGRPRPPARVATVALVLLAWLLPALAARADAAGAAADTASAVTVQLLSVTPPVSAPGTAVVVAGTVVNSSSTAIGAPVLRAVLNHEGLRSRAAVTAWASGQDGPGLPGPDSGQEVARRALGATLAPGASVAFSLTIPAADIANPSDFAALPLRLSVEGATGGGATGLGSLHTFLPWRGSIKRYEPLSIAWLAPVTLDPRPDLFGPDGAARARAWEAVIGPGSRVDRILSGTAAAPVTWVVDPAVVGRPGATAAAPGSAGSTPAPTPAPTPTAGSTPSASDTVDSLTKALADRLRSGAARHSLWSLPYADPDVSATLRVAPHDPTVAALLARTDTLQQQLGVPARGDIAWPAEGGLSRAEENQLRGLYSSAGLTAAIVPESTLPRQNGYTGDAARKSPDGLPLLAYDDGLSSLFAQTSSTPGAATVQQFLAQTLALLGELPGTRRTVLVAAPRTFSPSPGVLTQLFAAVRSAPWLSPTTTTDLLHRAVDALPERGTATTPTPAPAVPNPFDLGRSPLTAANLAALGARRTATEGVASVLEDGAATEADALDAVDQLTSTRWRGQSRGWHELQAGVSAATVRTAAGIRVLPSTVNFLADQGILKVTVVNDLDVAVHDVRLRLVPGSPRLRLDDQPPVLRIGGQSRTTVPLHVTALAAGLVPIEAELTAPNGTRLGKRAQVMVRVQPTGVWVYWVLGGIAGAVLLLGVARALGRTRPRVAAPSRENASL